MYLHVHCSAIVIERRDVCCLEIVEEKMKIDLHFCMLTVATYCFVRMFCLIEK